jgi:hypothetical protein
MDSDEEGYAGAYGLAGRRANLTLMSTSKRVARKGPRVRLLVVTARAYCIAACFAFRRPTQFVHVPSIFTACTAQWKLRAARTKAAA